MRIAPLAAALAALPLLLAPQPASACSLGSLWAPLDDRLAFFTGAATMDTLLAGAGNTEYGVGGGHFAPGTDREIYGQVIRVGEIGGAAAEGLPAGATEVVVVPWDYDAACRPLVWGRSAQFVTPGSNGFYIAQLRAPENWVDGKPTLDLRNPGHLPYTGAEPTREMRPDTPPDSMLTPGQLFGLYRAFPTDAQIQQDGVGALFRLREWIATNPELLGLEPVSWLIGGVVGRADRIEISRMDHPVGGTWRFDIRYSDGSGRVVYGRSDPGSTRRWSPGRDRFRWSPEQLLPAPPEGLVLTFTFADARAELPDSSGSLNYRRGRVHTVVLSSSGGGTQSEWPGWLDASFLQAALERDPIAQEASRQEYARYSARADAGLPEAMPATFSRAADGMLRVRQSFPLPDGQEVVVEGEQLSREALRPPG